MADKEYEIVYADQNEELIVLICLDCGEGLTEPSATIPAEKFDRVTAKHNSETCR